MEQRRTLARTIAYAAVSLLLMGLSAFWQTTMHTEGELGKGFSSALFGCFVIACFLIGGAAYAYISYVRRHPQFRSDVLLCAVTGLVLMVLTLICFLRYGGVGNTLTEESAVGVNFLIVVLSALPLPFMVRTAVAALSRVDRRGIRIAMWCIALAVVIVYIVLIATGGMFETMTYEAKEQWV